VTGEPERCGPARLLTAFDQAGESSQHSSGVRGAFLRKDAFNGDVQKSVRHQRTTACRHERNDVVQSVLYQLHHRLQGSDVGMCRRRCSRHQTPPSSKKCERSMHSPGRDMIFDGGPGGL
jgi:hypothetical protein